MISDFHQRTTEHSHSEPSNRLGRLVILAYSLGLLCLSSNNDLLFHTIAELSCVFFAGVIFLLVVNLRHVIEDEYLCFLGCIYLFVGILDLFHTLSYAQMGIWDQHGANLSMPIRVVARYAESISLCLTPLIINRRVNCEIIFSLMTVLFLGLLFSSHFLAHSLDCFDEGQGLANFIKFSETITIGFLIGSGTLFYYRRNTIDNRVYRLMMLAVMLTAVSEVGFSFYPTSSSGVNFFSHMMKILSFYCIYRAIVEKGLQQPHTLFFRRITPEQISLAESESGSALFSNHAGSHRMQEDFLQNLPIGIIVARGKNHCVDYINRYFLHLVGNPEVSPAKTPLSALLPEAVFNDLIALSEVAVKQGEPLKYQEYKIAFPAKNRATYWNIDLVPLRSSKRIPDRFMIIVSDVSENVETRKTVTSAIAKDDAILSSIVEGLLIFDANGDIQMANQAARDIFGLPPSALMEGATYRIFNNLQLCTTHNQAIKQSDWPISRVLAGEIVVNQKVLIRRSSDEKTIYLRFNGMPVLNEENEMILGVLTFVDFTSEWEYNQLLERSKSELELVVEMRTSELVKANRELKEFAYAASHDLHEPLRKIQAFGNRLADESRKLLPPKSADYLTRMLNAAGRMRTLIDALLRYSRVTSADFHYDLVDLNTVVGEAVEDLEGQLERVNGRVLYDNLTVIEADGIQMRRLFQNLINNGLKYNNNADPLVSIKGEMISPSAKLSDIECGWYQIEVKDNGIGIDNEYFEKIFIPFQRLHGRGHYEGSGIGLSICRQIVERHKGHITVVSTPGHGSIFKVTLPYRQRTEINT